MLPVPGVAHDSPSHVIDGLTARIEADPKRADLYWRRATEYRVLSRLPEAARDLQKALRLEPGFLSAVLDLSRVELAQNQTRRALATVNRALAMVPASDSAGRAPVRMLRAEILSARGDWTGALADCDAAIQEAGTHELDWYLARSQIHFQTGRIKEAVQGLKEGVDLTGSAVLEVEYIEALIDAGEFQEAATRIEPMLAESRWQSAWLVRRARVRIGRGDITAAQSDLLAALRELRLRLSGPQPDYSLLLQRGMAHALLGDIPQAERDLRRARDLGAAAGDPVAVRRLEAAVALNEPVGSRNDRGKKNRPLAGAGS